MQLALELLRIRKLFAVFDEAILRAQMIGVRSHGLSRRSGRRCAGMAARRCGHGASRARDLQSRHEAFEIALPFGIEFAGCRLWGWLGHEFGGSLASSRAAYSAGTCVGAGIGETSGAGRGL